MTEFGDIRSAAHAGDRDALRQALAAYDDDAVPPREVVAYVTRLDARLWPVTWRGGDGASNQVLLAHRHEHPTLSAYMMIGSRKIEVLSLDDAEASIQRALLPIRREALDNHWAPWAQANDSEEVRDATRLLYACLDDPALRAAARAAVVRAREARAEAWDAAWGAAWAAAWAAASDAAWAAVAASWAGARDVIPRVAVALIEEALR